MDEKSEITHLPIHINCSRIVLLKIAKLHNFISSYFSSVWDEQSISRIFERLFDLNI